MQRGLAFVLANVQDGALMLIVAEYRTGCRWRILTTMDFIVRVRLPDPVSDDPLTVYVR